MGLFVLLLYWNALDWPVKDGPLLDWRGFIVIGQAEWVMVALLGTAIAGGMFVVPLYAFLTTTVPKSETARTVAANNIVNSGAMVLSAILLTGLVLAGVSVEGTLLMVAIASIGAAWIAQKLHRACD
jgi:hypothetical protein